LASSDERASRAAATGARVSVEAEPVLRAIVLLGTLGLRVSEALSTRLSGAPVTGNAPVLVICLLALEGASRPRRLQRATGLTSGGVTRLVQRLEELGLVERSERQERLDRRAVLVSLTSAGHTVADAIADVGSAESAAIRQYAAQVLEILGPEKGDRP